MMKLNNLHLVMPAMVAAGLCQTASAQSNSYANMLQMTSAMNTRLWSAQADLERTYRDAERAGSQSSAPTRPAARPTPAPTAPPQFVLPPSLKPLSISDFPRLPGRIMPDQLATAFVPQDQPMMRTLYGQILAAYEIEFRRDNVAAAMAWTVAAGLEVNSGREVPKAEIDRLTLYYNEILAVTPQFTALAPQQKQMLYESLILTGGTATILYMKGKQRNDPASLFQAQEFARTILQQWARM